MYLVCALRAKGQTLILVFHMNNGTRNGWEEDHARLQDETKLQTNLG